MSGPRKKRPSRRKPHLYVLGVGGTLMGSIALLARSAGFRVSGSDKALYPPMSDQLAAADITVYEGFDPAQLNPAPDHVIVGNAQLPRGTPSIEHILDRGLNYTSGAEWLGHELLRDRWVIACAGTHGKTTTTAMVTWILHQAGLAPGYLIGGVPQDFNHSAALGETPFFVIEADEYDTSYFDRRAKFVHYRPRTLLINNLEYDHADIYPDLNAIQTQFHQLLRTVPATGLVIAPSLNDHTEEVLHRGCWTPIARFGAEPPRHPTPMDNGEWWHAETLAADGSRFEVWLNDKKVGALEWSLLGDHNVANALGAIAASRHAGVPPAVALEALAGFGGVKRRLEQVASVGGITVYDDFAHHPTAIRTTLQGLRNRVGNEEIIAVIEPRTHTMSLGALQNDLTTCVAPADQSFWFRGENIRWDLSEVTSRCVIPARQFDNLDNLMDAIAKTKAARSHVVIMSNGAFGGIYERLPAYLERARAPRA